MTTLKRYVAPLAVMLFASSCSPEWKFQESVGELLLGKNPSGITRPVTIVRWNREVLPEDLDWLASQTSTEFLRITGSISDADLKYMSELSNLRSLTLLNAARVTDEGLISLRKLTRLRFVDIQNSRITDSGLKHLESLTDLRELRLVNSIISGPGLEYLKGALRLETLTLEGSPVKDTGLTHLKEWKSLQYLNLSDTDVSEEGLKQLRQALPGCLIDGPIACCSRLTPTAAVSHRPGGAHSVTPCQDHFRDSQPANPSRDSGLDILRAPYSPHTSTLGKCHIPGDFGMLWKRTREDSGGRVECQWSVRRLKEGPLGPLRSAVFSQDLPPSQRRGAWLPPGAGKEVENNKKLGARNS